MYARTDRRKAGDGRKPVKLRRRQFQQLAASALALPAVSRVAAAQTYPAQPVRMVVGFAAGQAIDILARMIAQSLAEQFSQQFIVENKPGAGGNIAAESVARAPADGYTLLVIGANNPINTTLYDKLGFDLLRDFAPVAGIYRVYQVMEVNPAFPARTVPEFIAYAKANPGKINFGSAGTGSVAHVTGEWFKMMAGVDMQHVPYRGAPLALADLLGGQVQVMFDNLPSSIDHIRAGRLRALAVSTPTSLELLPGVPPMAEFLPDFETSAFAGIGAPAGVPREIVDKLNTGVTTALADPKLKARIIDLGGVPMPMTPAEFGLFLAAETEKWAKVIRAANIKPS
jgi:tripartite-type tricarboxylate transporter receptor subunit TctC